MQLYTVLIFFATIEFLPLQAYDGLPVDPTG